MERDPPPQLELTFGAQGSFSRSIGGFQSCVPYTHHLSEQALLVLAAHNKEFIIEITISDIDQELMRPDCSVTRLSVCGCLPSGSSSCVMAFVTPVKVLERSGLPALGRSSIFIRSLIQGKEFFCTANLPSCTLFCHVCRSTTRKSSLFSYSKAQSHP